MGNKFFISKKLRRKIEKDLNKRTNIEKEIDNDLEAFNNELDDETVFSIFKYVEEFGTVKQQQSLADIKNRYENSSLIIDDTLKLVDLYDKMCDFYNNREDLNI